MTTPTLTLTLHAITSADDLDAFAQAHDHGEPVVILHRRHYEWRLYRLGWERRDGWERWDEQGGTVAFRPVWETDTGYWFDTDWISPTSPAYVLEPREAAPDDVIERVARGGTS